MTRERWIAAEARAVEAGHRAVKQPDGSFRVISDSTPNKAYRVRVVHAGGKPIFDCRVEWRGADDGPHCNGSGRAHTHAALVARRLEREGELVWTEAGWMAPVTPLPETAHDFDAWFGTGGAS